MKGRRYAYGRRSPQHSARSFRSMLLMTQALQALGPAPPASNDYAAKVKVPWQMFGNDTIGDCVAADTAHTLMLRTANVGQIVVPTDSDVIALYSAVGGYVPGDASTDQGCDEGDMCRYLVANGFLGHKADLVGNVDPSSLDYIRWCVQLFGSCRIGLNLPGYAEDQFDARQPWDVSQYGDQTTAGHDVPIVGYRGGMFTVVTWGRAQEMTEAFFLKYCEEAHAELYFDWIAKQGMAPSGFDLDALAARLREMAS